MQQNIQTLIAQYQQEGKRFAVATVVDHWGSVSAKSGSKALIDENGHIVSGWIGGGCAESETCYQAVEAITEQKTRVFDIDLDDEMLGVGMPCGGAMKVFVDPFIPQPRLWLIGHGRVVQTLCSLGHMMGFEVMIDDPIAEHKDYPEASTLINDDIDYAQLTPTGDDYVIIATQHKGDHLSMKQAIESGAGYIALIASQKRAKLVLEFLDQEALSGCDTLISTPAGLDIAAHSPEEIALSVMAEVVMTRRGGSGGMIHHKKLSFEETSEALDNAARRADNNPAGDE
ncbi:XdhC family protein [Veronia pacifica]|uniref:XshC-Cox1-family protein n=1 Tax=Veronia pacifica TaxID=1080227 RepID=A0A1C3EED1_9GAMM|nr:XdhC family protein [Veronia pacifica]ODA31579.1 XshC-Cox1-family protein [Veronia pacifica]